MNGGLVQSTGEATMKPATLSERLEHEEKVLTERLDKVQSLRKVLDNSPELQGVLDALTELGHYHY